MLVSANMAYLLERLSALDVCKNAYVHLNKRHATRSAIRMRRLAAVFEYTAPWNKAL